MRPWPCDRRCSRFTLRGLLCGVTLICILASLNANRAHHQRRAVNAVIQLGGEVTYDFDSLAESDGVVQSWTRRILFYSFCEPVVEVNLTASDVCDVTDSDLSCLKNLPDLKKLHLVGNRGLNGSGLRHVRGLHRLESLNLGMTGINDDAVRHIPSMKNLRELCLFDTTIGDDSANVLKELESIERLELCFTRITDATLESIKELPRLVELDVVGTRVTDVGLKELEGMQSLRKLHLGGNVVRRGEIAWVTCRVTAEGAADFERKVPWCKVRY